MHSRFFVLVISTLAVLLTLLPATPGSASEDLLNARQSSATMTLIDEESTARASFALNIADWSALSVSFGGDLFDEVSIPGETSLSPLGYPELPSIVRMVLIPPESGVEAKILNEEIIYQAGVRPVPGRRDENGEPYLEAAMLDMSGYSEAFNTQEPRDADGFWPAQTIELGRPAILRGYRILPVRINPIRWNPETGDLQVTEDLEFELNYDTEANRVNLVQNPQRPRPSANAFRIVSDLVVNPPEPPRDLDEHAGAILYVTGAAQNFNQIVDALNPLMEWRRKMGWTVQLLRVNNNGDRNAILNDIRNAYRNNDPAPEYVIIVGDGDGAYTMASHVHANVGNPYETDHNYAMLDGDDILGDVAVGRFVCDSPQMLTTQVLKTIQYESDPFMGDNEAQRGWYQRGALASTDWRNGASANNLIYWTRDLLLSKGWNQVNTLVSSAQNQQPNPTQLITENFNNGISIYLHRGWVGLNGFAWDQVQNALRNGRMWPLVILATCNTGDFVEHAYNVWSYIERFMWHTNGGSIGAVGTGGATHTYYNNSLAGGMISALLCQDIRTQGWALQAGKVNLYDCYFERGDINHATTHTENWLAHTYIYNLMGDPAVDLFTAIPSVISVEHPQALRIGETIFRALVTDADEEPLEGALVCLYKTGAMQIKGWTDEFGEVSLPLDPEQTQNGSIFLTVSGHNLRTYTRTLAIEDAADFIGASAYEIDDDDEDASRGDGDAVANPGERLELTVVVTNLGENNLDGELTLTLEALNGCGSVIENEVRLDQAPAAGESVNAQFLVELNSDFNPDIPASFGLTAQVGENHWESAIAIPIAGPVLEVSEITWVGDPLTPGSLAEMRLTVRNVGAKATTALLGHLETRQRTLSAPVGEGQFDAVAVDGEETIQQALRVNAHPMHVPGSVGKLSLVVEGEDFFRQVIPFEITVGEGGDGTPFGPDDFGYVCFDNTDGEWFAVPEYAWVEIDPDFGEIEGTDTQLRDQGISQDASLVIDLPFVARYYDQEFNQATICTNGWMAMGSHLNVMASTNRPIPSGLLVSGMLCPFWDDLVTHQEGGVFYWYDEEEGRFIVEWSRMRRLMGGQSPVETFQVIILDPEQHPSLDGNGDVIFQYLTIEDRREPADAYGDTPYATVGIVSPDLTTGLQYSYWNERTPGAAPLAAERAIRFTTLVDFDTAHMFGTVLDDANNEPLPGVLVRTDFGFWAITDSLGQYDIPELLVDEELLYTVVASKEFYNDSIITDIEVRPDAEIRIDFALLHPEFALDFAGANVAIRNKNANDWNIPIINNGNGSLSFTSKVLFTLPGEDHPPRDEMFRVFQSIDVTGAPTGVTEEGDTLRVGNAKINGVVFVDSLFYVSGAGSERNHQLAVIYRFNRAGVFVDSLTLPWEDNNGIRGLEYDGEYIWGAFKANVYCFDPASMALVDSLIDFDIADSLNVRTGLRDVAYDPETQTYFTMGITDPILQFDREGNVVKSWRPAVEGLNLRKYGLSWHPMREGPKKLFIHAILDSMTYLYACDPVTEETEELLVTRGNIFGIDVTDRWNSSVWTLCRVVDGAGDHDVVQVLELEPNTTWLFYEPAEGVVEAQDDVCFHLRVDAADRPLDRYWVTIRYDFNAAPGWFEIPVSMTIDTVSSAGSDDALPRQFSLDQNYPNPFNPSTSIRYSLEEAAKVELQVFDITGRLVQTLAEGMRMPGSYQTTFDASKLPSGIYVCQLKAGEKTAMRKMALLK